MSSILLKLLRDFRKAKGRFFLLILAASLSGWGISSVLYGYFLTERDFEENFTSTFPADITLIIDDYQDELLVKILGDQNVIGVERREVLSARIRNSQESWMPLILYGVENINKMKLDVFRILDEENRSSGKLLIEKNAWSYLDQDQNTVEILFQGMEDPVEWEVSGLVHDARQAPARMEGLVYAYSTSLDKIEPYLPEGQRRLLIETNINSDKSQLELVAERLKTIINQAGGRVLGVNIPNPGEHIHQPIIEGIAFLQVSGGITLSIMGIILLSLILLVWVYSQISTIGVMKAIGASTKSIFQSYIVILLLIIFSGLTVGMPLGYQTAVLYNQGVAFFQNFEVVTALLPLWVHILVGITGALIPLSFGVVPLLRGARITVNEALNKVIYSSTKGVVKVFQKLTKNGKAKYQLSNIFRHEQRTLLTILLLAVGVGLYISSANTDYSVRTDLQQFSNTSKYEVMTILPEEVTFADLAFLNELEQTKKYLAIDVNRVSFVPPASGSSELTTIKTFSNEVEIDKSYVLKGEIDKKCSECIYISGREMEKNFEGVELGEIVELTYSNGNKRGYRFSGILSDLVVIGAPLMAYDEEATNAFNGLLFELKPNLSQKEKVAASNEIDDKFLFNGINLLGRWTISNRMAGITGHLSPSFLVIKILGVFASVLGLLGLLIILNLTIQERTREIGIMKSLGATSEKVSGMLAIEFLGISLLAFLLGIILAIPVTKALIKIIAEVIIRHPVLFKNDIISIALTMIIIVAIQSVIILFYGHLQIKKNARKLLDHNF